MLHCAPKAVLYDIGMSLGNRIKIARERLRPKVTQGDVGAAFGVTDKAVSGWERDAYVPEHAKLVKLRKILKVTYAWLLDGNGPPPDPDSPEVLLEDLAPSDREIIAAMLITLREKRDRVA